MLLCQDADKTADVLQARGEISLPMHFLTAFFRTRNSFFFLIDFFSAGILCGIY